MMDNENYHNELLRKVSTIYNIDYNELCIKIPYKLIEIRTLDDFTKEYLVKSLKELQELAIKYNVSKSGKKEKIIERLYPFLSKNEVSNINEQNEYKTDKMNNEIIPNIIKKDVCIGTDEVEEKEEGISERDLLLLLKTHGLSLDGTRRDLIDRLKNFYRETNTKDIIKEHIFCPDDEYVSRVEINEKFMTIVAGGISIEMNNGKWKKTNNIIGEARYLLIPNKNWIFKETEMSYEFIGIANIDHTYELCDIPEELIEMSL